jgi:hypothetical protein
MTVLLASSQHDWLQLVHVLAAMVWLGGLAALALTRAKVPGRANTDDAAGMNAADDDVVSAPGRARHVLLTLCPPLLLCASRELA